MMKKKTLTVKDCIMLFIHEIACVTRTFVGVRTFCHTSDPGQQLLMTSLILFTYVRSVLFLVKCSTSKQTRASGHDPETITLKIRYNKCWKPILTATTAVSSRVPGAG